MGGTCIRSACGDSTWNFDLMLTDEELVLLTSLTISVEFNIFHTFSLDGIDGTRHIDTFAYPFL